MIDLPDKIHSTAIDNKAVDSIQAEYIDEKGRVDFTSIDNVKDALDYILDKLSPATTYNFSSVSYYGSCRYSSEFPGYTEGVTNYYGVTQRLEDRNFVLGTLYYSLDPGNTNVNEIVSIEVLSWNIEILAYTTEDISGHIEITAGMMKDAWMTLHHRYTNENHATEYISIFLRLNLKNKITGNLSSINSNPVEVSFEWVPYKYTPWPEVINSISLTPSSRIVGEDPIFTFNWDVNGVLSKTEYDDDGNPIELAAEVTFPKSHYVLNKMSYYGGPGMISVNIPPYSGSTSFSGVPDMEGARYESINVSISYTAEPIKDAKGLVPGGKGYLKTDYIDFIYKNFYFWSKQGNLTVIPEGTRVSEFTDKKNFTPPDETGWFLYILHTRDGLTFMGKLIGSLDVYYAELTTQLTTRTTTLPDHSWDLPGKEQVKSVSGYCLYRSVNNIVHGQTVKIQQ